ncbi:MAG: XdhC family protein [Piscirickettsiaceae bacterium]|nr:XdhC family protein [Piscirickettsiaceae bacterium]
MQSMDLEVVRGIIRWLNDGHQVSLVTVVNTWGSSPRPVGSLLGIRQDGALIGSVSGGCIEDDLVERLCNKSIDGSLPQLVSYGVTRDESQRFGLPCGGTLQLVIEPLNDIENLQQILDAIEQGLIVSRHLNMQTGQITIQPATYKQALTFDAKELKTVFGPRWRLLIIGAAQVSHFLADMATALDYQVMVCDPREAYLSTWPLQDIPIIRRMPDDVVIEMIPDQHTAIVCLSHDPKLDDMALLEALISDAFYVGAIGSHSNNQKRRERMAMFDISEDEIARLHGPIGLSIGSKTPPEIAISILAEITAIRHGVHFKHSSQIVTNSPDILRTSRVITV